MQALALALVLLQAPGDGWAFAQVPAREVKTLYWDPFGTTETFVSVIPAGPEEGRPLIRLIFQAFFAGKEANGTPDRMVLRALGLPLTVVRDYTLSLVVDHETFDLALACSLLGGPGPPCQLLGEWPPPPGGLTW